MNKTPDASPRRLVASAGSYSVYEVVNVEGKTAYELVGSDGATIPPSFGRLQAAMAAMTAMLARPGAGGADKGVASAPHKRPTP